MRSKLDGEIQWPSDEEMEKMATEEFAFFQNSEFQDVACVVDGTEIRVSRPSKEPFQRLRSYFKMKCNVEYIGDTYFS